MITLCFLTFHLSASLVHALLLRRVALWLWWVPCSGSWTIAALGGAGGRDGLLHGRLHGAWSGPALATLVVPLVQLQLVLRLHAGTHAAGGT